MCPSAEEQAAIIENIFSPNASRACGGPGQWTRIAHLNMSCRTLVCVEKSMLSSMAHPMLSFPPSTLVMVWKTFMSMVSPSVMVLQAHVSTSGHLLWEYFVLVFMFLL